VSKSKIFLILSLSFIGGVFGASFYYPKIVDLSYLYLLLVLAIILLAINHKNLKIVVLSMSVVVFVFGAHLVSGKFQEIENLDLDGQEFSGEVVISKEPEVSGSRQKIIVSPIDPQKNFKLLINSFDGSPYSFGEKLQVSCVLKIPKSQFEGNSTFNYQMYLAKDGIFYECQKPKIESLSLGEGNRFLAGIFWVKNRFKEKIEKNIPSPEAGLVSGLLLGGDDMLSKEWQEKFSVTGMTHIVAVSGYNVTIIAEYLMLTGIFLGLWRKKAFWFAVAGIVIFITMIGLPSSGVRAGVMGTLLLWAAKNGRLANSQNAIIFSAVVMLLINPLILRYDVGFQLSFLATLGIVYLYPIFENLIVKRNKVFGITEIFCLTMAAQIFVLPIILFNFGNLSLISPLANVLILPIVPLAMLLGFLAATVAFIFEPLAIVFSWLAYLPLKYETLVIDFLAGFQYSAVEARLSWWGLSVWYIILAVVVYRAKRKKINA
jgi:competence protein ComEC